MAFVDFTEEMRREYTILAPDIFPTHMELLTKVFSICGYHVEILHEEGKQVIDSGLKYIHNDMCYPAICAVGQQLHALTSGKYDVHKVALIQYQTGGGCRASNYIFLLRKALENMGLGFVPVISLNFSGLEKYSGFKITPRFLLMGLRALVYGDMLLLLKNHVRPYEKTPGSTAALVQEWIQTLSGQFERGKGMSGGAMRKNLRRMAAEFHALPRVERECRKVGIVGEIYVKYSAFGNNRLEEFLASQGCEYRIPGVLGFFQYCFSDAFTDQKYYGTSRRRILVSRAIEWILGKWENALRNALKPYPEFIPPAAIEQVEKLADRVIDRGVKMGEGWLLPGECAELIEDGYPNIICAQPFGCLPNHIAGKGTIRRLRELYPDANIFPVDYDAGASKVNQENRIKLMLAIADEEAKERSGAEC